MNANMYYNNNPNNNYGGVNTNMNDNNWKPAYYPTNDLETGNTYPQAHESDNYKINTELTMRLGFIRKVYGILSAQLILTTLMVMVAMSSSSIAYFQKTHKEFIWISLIGSIIILLAICCIPGVSRKVPINYVLLFSFTFFEGYIVSALCSHTNPRLVLMAAAMTCGITILLTFYACTTKTDFTLCGSMLFIVSCCLFLMCIFAMFFKFLTVVVATVGIFLYAVYLVYDTQLLLGNKENSLDMEDYILGALMLYLDVINMFIHILQLLKSVGGD